ncbi:MAG: DUF4230 domain-containing protein [Spirochaetia bacterium]|jgi:hypothetical protein|nr:DUF4230 domain-containing protein [Spirochaetia bacterium]
MKQKNWFKYLPILLLLSFLLSCTPGQKISKPVIENQIRGILDLPTVEYIYREIIYVGQEARFLGIKHLDKRLLFAIDLVINAGIDLTKGIEIRNMIDGSIQIILPEPEILTIDADESTIYQFFVKEWGDKVSHLDYYDEIGKSKDNVKNDAIERGILFKAKENTENMIFKIFSVYGFTNVSFKWRDL